MFEMYLMKCTLCDRVYLIILRYHSTKRYSSMLVDMVKYSFKHFTTNIVKVNINTIRKIPAKLRSKTVETVVISEFLAKLRSKKEMK